MQSFNLEGSYLFKIDGAKDQIEVVSSSKDDKGVITLTIDEDPEKLVLNGVKTVKSDGTASLVICHSLAVILYRFENGEITESSTYTLDDQKNLVLAWLVRGESFKLSGIRQAK